MPYQKLAFKPGIHKDDSPLEAEGYFIDGNGVRFVNGLPETIYGDEKASSSQLLGICRGAITYADNSRNPLAAFGTHLRLYSMDVDGNFTDITPATSYSGPAQVSISFTTSIGSATVAAAWTSHGLIANQKFKLENATVAAVGGVTIAGTYVVDDPVTDANNFTFTAAQTATSGAGPTASSVDTTVYLAPGQTDGLGGLGFGTGGFGTGGYGSSASGYTLYPRTYTMAPWGQNLLANPRGEAIYEWAPYTSASELVTNGDFAVTTGWTPGAGWTIGAGMAIGSAGSGALSQTISPNAGAFHLLSFNLSASAGTLLPTFGGLSIGAATSTNGWYRRAFFADSSSGTLAMNKDASFTGTLDNISVKVLTTAQIVPNAPTQVGSMFVTAERIVVACGSNLNDTGTGTTTFDPLQLDWCDAENNQDWAPTNANLAGGYTLSSGGRIVRGVAGNGENLIWTDTSLWIMRYNGNPDKVYDFIEIGQDCGLIGPNACVCVGSVWYWMTPAGAIMAYSGSVPAPIPCSLSRDVKDNLAFVQQDKVFAHSRVGKNYAEAWWRYPDIRDGNEVSRYILVNTLDGSWSCGTTDRAACAPASIFEYPLAADTSGFVWFEEKGFSHDGGARSWFLDGAYIAKAGGNIIINGVRPDSDDLQGGYSITPYSRFRDIRGIHDRTHAAVNITAATGQKSMRPKGEQIRLRWSGNAAPSFWRMGATQFDIITRDTGK